MNGENSQQEGPQKEAWQFKPEQAPSSPAQQNQQAPQQAEQVDFMPQEPLQAQAGVPDNSLPEIRWTASEFVVHEKSFNWYIGFAASSIIAVAVIYLWTKDTLSVVAAIILVILLAFAAARKPRTVEYGVGPRGITMAQHFFAYSEFKSFGIIQEGVFEGIVFTPLKRFMPPLTIYFAPEDEEKISFVLSSHLPYSPVTTDAFDRMLRRLRF